MTQTPLPKNVFEINSPAQPNIYVSCFQFVHSFENNLNECSNAWMLKRSFDICVVCVEFSIDRHRETERTTINLILRHFIGTFEWIKYHNQEFIGGHFDGRCFLAAINLCSLIPVSVVFYLVVFTKNNSVNEWEIPRNKNKIHTSALKTMCIEMLQRK